MKMNMQYGKYNMDKEYIIEKLTKLMIKQSLEDRQNKKETYIRKVDAYKDLIKFFKEVL